MEHIQSYRRLKGVDIGHGDDLHPVNGEGRVGKSGMDKNLTLSEILEIVYNMEQKPNILIKAGINAKWYIKNCVPSEIDSKIEKQNWKDTSRCTMYIIEWE